MRPLLAVLGVFASFASAADSVVSLFNPGIELEPLYASIVGSGATATTYSMYCSPDLPYSPCLLPTTAFLFVQGPKTVSYVIDSSNTVFSGLTVDCTLEGNVLAICTTSGDEGLPETDTFALQTSESNFFLIADFVPVTLTSNLAGAGVTGGAAPSSLPSSVAASSTTTTTGAGAASTTSSASAAAAVSSGSVSSSMSSSPSVTTAPTGATGVVSPVASQSTTPTSSATTRSGAAGLQATISCCVLAAAALVVAMFS